MKAKGLIAFVLCCVAFFFGCESKGSSSTPTARHGNMQSCTSLSQEEQSFAQKLRPYNQTVFCEEMTPSQRDEAMRLARHGDFQYGRGKYYTPDEAVEKVTKQAHSTGRSYRRSCQS